MIRPISFQNEAFRGHDENKTLLNQGKFLEEVKFLAKYYPPLQRWLDNHPGNVSWLSPDIQNEMIEILANNIIDIVKIQVNESRDVARTFKGGGGGALQILIIMIGLTRLSR